VQPPAGGPAVLPAEATVSIVRGERDDPSPSRELIPLCEC
jgi:hypothetical protein